MSEKNNHANYLLEEEQLPEDLQKLFDNIEINFDSLSADELNKILEDIDLNQIRDFSQTPEFYNIIENAKNIKILNNYTNKEEDLIQHTTTKIIRLLSQHKEKIQQPSPNQIYSEDLSHSINMLSILSQNSYRAKIDTDLKR